MKTEEGDRSGEGGRLLDLASGNDVAISGPSGHPALCGSLTFLFFEKIYIGVELIYNVVLASAI